MKNSKKMKAILVLSVFVFSLLAPKAVMLQAAIAEITVNEDEYNVYVEDYSGTAYAKFNKTMSNVELYSLSLFDGDYDAEEKITEALKKSGNNADNYEMVAVDVILYKEDSEGELYPVTGTAPEMTVICEIPAEFTDLESKVKIFAINSSGKVDNISYTLVDVDGYISARFTVKRFTQYAFAVTNKDIEDYENGLYEEDEEGDEEEDTATPTPTKKPTAVPTNSANSGGTSKPSTSGSSGVKDNVPKTGDDFSLAKVGIAILVTGTLFVSAVYYIKKKE